MTNLTAVLFLKRQLLKIAKSPVLSTVLAETITQNLNMGMI